MKGLLIAFLIHVLTANIVLSQTKPCPGKHARLPAITGLTYTAARKKLLAARWQPVRTKSFNEVNSDDQERIFWRRGYVELQDCGGASNVFCYFLYKDAYGNQLHVTTEGEELPQHKTYARVTDFEFVCD